MDENSREYQKAVHFLCSEIREGNINVGDRIPTERVIAEELNISRNSTREAIRCLENMGIIESHRGSGNYYTGNVSRHISEMIRTLLSIKHITAHDITDFRRTMEKAVCSSIIAHESYDLSKAEEILSRIPASIEEESINDRAFHAELINASGNIFWIELMSAVSEVYRDMIQHVLENSDDKQRKHYHEVHFKIYNALKNKDKEKCEAAVNEHYDLIDEQLNNEHIDTL